MFVLVARHFARVGNELTIQSATVLTGDYAASVSKGFAVVYKQWEIREALEGTKAEEPSS